MKELVIGQVYEEDCVNDVDDDLADHDDDHPGRVKEWVVGRGTDCVKLHSGLIFIILCPGTWFNFPNFLDFYSNFLDEYYSFKKSE